VQIRRRHLVSLGKKHKLHIVDEIEDGVVHLFCLQQMYEESVEENVPLTLDERDRICKRCMARAQRILTGRY
jgi:hypothetical protein